MNKCFLPTTICWLCPQEWWLASGLLVGFRVEKIWACNPLWAANSLHHTYPLRECEACLQQLIFSQPHVVVLGIDGKALLRSIIKMRYGPQQETLAKLLKLCPENEHRGSSIHSAGLRYGTACTQSSHTFPVENSRDAKVAWISVNQVNNFHSTFLSPMFYKLYQSNLSERQKQVNLCSWLKNGLRMNGRRKKCAKGSCLKVIKATRQHDNNALQNNFMDFMHLESSSAIQHWSGVIEKPFTETFSFHKCKKKAPQGLWICEAKELNKMYSLIKDIC